MDDKITVEVELKSKLDKLTQLDTSQLKLSEKQKEALEINKQGAETALKNNDLKEFRFYFNQFADILKKATVSSGKISQNLQDLTKYQEGINKKIQEFSPFSACVIPFTEEAYSIGAIPVAFLNCFEK